MDIYLPGFHHRWNHQQHQHQHHHHHDHRNNPLCAGTTASSSSSNSGGCRVVVFVHGGCWVSGDKWLYAPLAARCAAEGAIAVVIQYTLYPESLKNQLASRASLEEEMTEVSAPVYLYPDFVVGVNCAEPCWSRVERERKEISLGVLLAEGQQGEASTALSWVFDNIARYGGDPNCVFLCGHSSGSHTVAMLVWRRFKKTLLGAAESAAQRAAAHSERGELLATERGVRGGRGGEVEGEGGMRRSERGETTAVGGSGSRREEGRGAAGQQQHDGEIEDRREEADTRQPYCVIGLSGIFDLHYMHTYTVTTGTAPLTCFAEAVGGPAAFARGSPPNLFSALAEAVAVAGLGTDAAAKGGAGSTGKSTSGNAPSPDAALSLFFSEFGKDAGNHILSGIADGRIRPAAILPPMLLQCSPGDAYAPPHCSLALVHALRRLGGRAKVAVYSSVHHAQFACLWKPWPQPRGSAEAEALARKRSGRVWLGDGLQMDGGALLGGGWSDWLCRCWGLGEAGKANKDLLDVVVGRTLLEDVLASS
ncbi:hypothetical protein CLOP_g15615 [Closterium sp. NIES-67]|nr:hypothetical protein CLOP_g15615 [Closterium sp. NIES-67]